MGIVNKDAPLPQAFILVGIIETDGQVQEVNVGDFLQQCLVPFLANEPEAYPVPHFLEMAEEIHVQAIRRHAPSVRVKHLLDNCLKGHPRLISLKEVLQVDCGGHILPLR